MAAPSGTKWGSIVGNYGRIGIYASVSNTATETKVTIETWFWSKYSVSDGSNTYYYNANASTATTSYGSVSISTTSNSGGGWSTANQVKLKGPSTYTYDRGTSNKTVSYAVKLTGINVVGGTMTATTSISVPAKASYTVSYNANGGSGAPSSQTKWYGTNITLSSSTPSRSGYTFQGWATSASGGVAYNPGSTYSSNASVTLYAVWKIITYSVSYNANGGSGAPGTQYKNYAANLTLSSVKPTRANYNFKGWATSASGGVAYNAGATYSSNSSITLYAVWELAYYAPTITNLKATRCNSSGTITESGTYAKVTFNWECCQLVGTNNVVSPAKIQALGGTVEVAISGTKGAVSQVVGGGAFANDNSYSVSVTIKDSKNGTTTISTTLPSTKFLIDFKAGGKGVAIGKPADTNNLFDVAFPSLFRNGLEMSLSGGKILTGDQGLELYAKTPYIDFHYGNSDSDYTSRLIAQDGYLSCSSKLIAGGVTLSDNNISCYNIYLKNVYTSGAMYLNDKVLCDYNSGLNIGYGAQAAGLQTKIFGKYIDFYSGGSCVTYNGNYWDADWTSGRFFPNQVGTALGSSTASQRWYRLYAANACSVSSDRRFKEDIVYLDEIPITFTLDPTKNIFEQFFENLKPSAFTLVADEYKRMRIGFIAQDVEEALNKVGLDEKNTDFVSRYVEKDEETGEEKDEYALCYTEFVALNTYMIQKAHKKIEEQQNKIDNLEEQVQELKELVLKLTK